MNVGSLYAFSFFVEFYLLTGANKGVAIFIIFPNTPQPTANVVHTVRTGINTFNILSSPFFYCRDIIYIICFRNITNSVYFFIFLLTFLEYRYFNINLTSCLFYYVSAINSFLIFYLFFIFSLIFSDILCISGGKEAEKVRAFFVMG